jgi:hypothetical protein
MATLVTGDTHPSLYVFPPRGVISGAVAADVVSPLPGHRASGVHHHETLAHQFASGGHLRYDH